MPELTDTDPRVAKIVNGASGFQDFSSEPVDSALAAELARHLVLSADEQEVDAWNRALNPHVEKFLTDYLINEHGKLWLEQAGTIIGQAGLPHAAIISYVNGLTWRARSRGFSASKLYPLRQIDLKENTPENFVRAIAVLQAARYDFNHDLIRALLNRIEPQILAPENIGDAFRLFVRICQNGEKPVDDDLMNAIRNICREGSFSKVQHLVLHGMCLTESEKYADLIIEVAQLLRKQNSSDAIVYLREAEGYRLKKEYSQALEILEKGLIQHDPDDVTVHTDFVRDRMLIKSEARIVNLIGTNLGNAKNHMDGLLRKHEEHLATVIADSDAEAERKNREMLFRVMEIMALFVALIGLLAVVVGAAAIGELELWERFLILSSGSIFFIFFFLMIHFIAGPKRRKS